MKKLNYLIALAKIGHFGRAAEACHISQPAFSSTIQNLEDELGVTLVQRGQRSFMGLTPAGECILLRAQRLADDWDCLKQEAATANQQLTGTLRLGAIPTTLAISPLFTDAYRNDYPNIHFKIHSLCAIRKADLARKLNIAPVLVDRLLSLKHKSRIEQLEQALALLDKRLLVDVG